MNGHHSRSGPRRRLLGVAAAFAAVALGAATLPADADADAAAAPTPRRIVSGWDYFSSTTSTSLSGLAANADLFTDVSPFWYSAQWTGSTSRIAAASYAANRATVLPALRATGVKVMPTITDGMAARRMAAVLNATTTRAKLVAQIVALVTTDAYDGIDLDFEGFAFNDGSSSWATTRPGWIAFVTQLSAGLHAHGKQLSITVPAGSATSSDSTGYWVYAWSQIGPSVDRLRIMAYDYSPSTPGPISPFAWVQRVIAHAVTQVASGKIQIGVAAYGRDWYTGTSGTCPTLAPVGASTAQGSAFFDDLAWAYRRHAYTSQGASSWIDGLFSSGTPGVAFAQRPVATLDPAEHESTFRYRVSFTGRVQPATVRPLAVGALTGSKAVIVSSVTGIHGGMSVSGSGVAPETKVDAPAGAVVANPVPLSIATTSDVTGALTFSADSVPAIAVAGPTPATLTVPLVAAGSVHVGDSATAVGLSPGSVVTAVETATGLITLNQARASGWADNTTVTFQTPTATAAAVGGAKGAQTVLIPSSAGVTVGAAVAGTGVAAGATVTGVNGTTITLSLANNESVTGVLAVTPAPVTQACTVSRVGWYADASSAASTATLVAQYQLLGIVQWTLGGGDLSQWFRLRSYARTIAPTPSVATLSSPSLVTYGTHPTVVITTTSAGLRVAGAGVTLFFRPTGASSWTRLATVVSAADGTARFTPPVTANGSFRADVGGTFDRASTAVQRPVALRTYAFVAAPKVPVKARVRTTIGVHLLPRHQGQVVILQVLRSGGWVTLGRRSTDALGRASFAVTPVGLKARHYYRFLVGGWAGAAATTAYATITTL